MTEEEARAQVARLVDAPAMAKLERFATMVIAETERQNLIARSTIATIWTRHILDSVQLIGWGDEGTWIDIGTGGGFPGVVVAIARGGSVKLVEPRGRRAAFLNGVIDHLGLAHVHVFAGKIENMQASASVISARAVGPIRSVFNMAQHCAEADTTWLLPRGVGWRADMDAATVDWKAMFHVEQSCSDPTAGIVIAKEVSRR